jgi:hypothetical protein
MRAVKLAVLWCITLSLSDAQAGERRLGTMIVSDAGTVNNATTGYGSAGCAGTDDGVPGETTPGSCDQAFRIPTSAKITVQCDDAAIIGVNVRGVDAGTGMPVIANEKFPSSTRAGNVKAPLPDAGTYYGGVVSIAPAVGAASARCRVYERDGRE